MKSQRFNISISPKGEITFIYTDMLANLIQEGKSKIVRVSSVEPDENGQWVATMIDGAKLGPFKLRQDALAAEVAYIESRIF